MNRNLNLRSSRQSQAGAGLIEVLVTLVILMLGLLGLVGLMVQAQRAQTESYQRVQALVVLQDMVNRINVNRKSAACYASAAVLGTGYADTPTCTTGTADQNARAVADMQEWSALLLGSAETITGGGTTSNIGAMIGARGCVTTISANVYQVSVVWQGVGKTSAPAGVTCANGLYGDEKLRRAVSVSVQIASLS